MLRLIVRNLHVLMCPCSAILASTNDPAPQHDPGADDLGCAADYHSWAHKLRPADLNRCGPRAAVLPLIGIRNLEVWMQQDP